jgi:predicted ATPase/DNA-binding CsgD family transcriptional regulator
MPDETTTTAGLLERAAELGALERCLAAVRAERRGHLVLIAGEAGIGKTALVRALCAGGGADRVLWGACDALHTPRPLGPLLDMADSAGGALAAAVAGGSAPGALLAALADDLRRPPPAVVVLEDLHWADEATLDVLRLLARRIESVPALVVATYRDDGLQRGHPLRLALGELPREATDRMRLRPLSLEAVTALAGTATVDAGELHRRTGGNAFYITEVVAADGGEIPDTVREAVLARVARLPPDARAVLDAVAIVPLRAELWLLEALAGGELEGLDACLRSGMLRADGDAVAFRHEIARVAVEEALAPHERARLHRRALAALAAAGAGRGDLARLAHHADAAGDPDAVLRPAPAAGERAARLGSHREAAAHFGRALRHADRLEPARRAELLERRSYECYLVDAIDEALDAREHALREHRAAGDVRRAGDAHRWLSRLHWFSGDNAGAEREARIAIELLERLPPGRELAMAWSNMAQLRMLAADREAAAVWGGQAIALAERLGDVEVVAHALNNVGAAERARGLPEGTAKLERSLALAFEAGLEEHVARAYTNLAATAIDLRDYADADRRLEAGIAYSTEHDLDSWADYMAGYRARSDLDQGRWDAAAARAGEVLANPRATAPTRVTPLVVLGSLRARRGDPDPWTPLDEAHAIAREAGELQRIAPVAAARAEARWLAGDDGAVAAETDAAARLARAQGDARAAGELAVWRRRAGGGGGDNGALAPATAADPFARELAGHAEAAAARWAALGCPYEAALALAHAADADVQRRALDALQRLGARPAARRVARALRERGLRDVRRGPHQATRANPAGLTPREVEVLALVAQGRRNADIAGSLFVSEKTVGHHVSAILRKLDVRTRGEAGAAAARLGIVER